MTVLRDGKEVKLEIPTVTSRPLLLPYLSGKYPSYFIVGPLALTEATQEFLAPFLRANANRNDAAGLIYVGSELGKRAFEAPAFPGQRLVVVPGPFFPHKLSKGYPSPGSWVLKSVNGTEVKNLVHAVTLIRDSKDEFLSFEFSGRRSQRLIFAREEMLKSTEEILTDNSVRTQGSEDLMKVWGEKAGSK